MTETHIDSDHAALEDEVLTDGEPGQTTAQVGDLDEGAQHNGGTDNDDGAYEQDGETQADPEGADLEGADDEDGEDGGDGDAGSPAGPLVDAGVGGSLSSSARGRSRPTSWRPCSTSPILMATSRSTSTVTALRCPSSTPRRAVSPGAS